MEQAHILDGDPPEDDIVPAVLGASHYLECRDFLGLLECFALLAYQSHHVSDTSALAGYETLALQLIEAFAIAELESMRLALRADHHTPATDRYPVSAVLTCCRASESTQRTHLIALLGAINAQKNWTLSREWRALQVSERATFQAAAVITAWIHQRLELMNFAGRLAPQSELWTVRPFTLRTMSLPPATLIRRSRLAGWSCAHGSGKSTCAGVLVVPTLRDPSNMVEAMRASIQERTGPFFRRPPAERGVFVTELEFDFSSRLQE